MNFTLLRAECFRNCDRRPSFTSTAPAPASDWQCVTVNLSIPVTAANKPTIFSHDLPEGLSPHHLSTASLLWAHVHASCLSSSTSLFLRFYFCSCVLSWRLTGALTTCWGLIIQIGVSPLTSIACLGIYPQHWPIKRSPLPPKWSQNILIQMLQLNDRNHLWEKIVYDESF